MTRNGCLACQCSPEYHRGLGDHGGLGRSPILPLVHLGPGFLVLLVWVIQTVQQRALGVINGFSTQDAGRSLDAEDRERPLVGWTGGPVAAIAAGDSPIRQDRKILSKAWAACLVSTLISFCGAITFLASKYPGEEEGEESAVKYRQTCPRRPVSPQHGRYRDGHSCPATFHKSAGYHCGIDNAPVGVITIRTGSDGLDMIGERAKLFRAQTGALEITNEPL